MQLGLESLLPLSHIARMPFDFNILNLDPAAAKRVVGSVKTTTDNDLSQLNGDEDDLNLLD